MFFLFLCWSKINWDFIVILVCCWLQSNYFLMTFVFAEEIKVLYFFIYCDKSSTQMSNLLFTNKAWNDLIITSNKYTLSFYSTENCITRRGLHSKLFYFHSLRSPTSQHAPSSDITFFALVNFMRGHSNYLCIFICWKGWYLMDLNN
jgi:hypothetical protein